MQSIRIVILSFCLLTMACTHTPIKKDVTTIAAPASEPILEASFETSFETPVSRAPAAVGAAAAAYEDYVARNLCSASKPDDCFNITSYVATRSSGRKVKVDGVYSFYDKDSVQGIPLPHLMLTLLRLMRNAQNENPKLYSTVFFNQIDYMLSLTVERNGARVWENVYGFAQGMEQAEYSAFFASISAMMLAQGNKVMADSYFDTSLKMIRSLQLDAGKKTGGVRSKIYTCGSKSTRLRNCVWFHSRGLGVPGADKPYTVLNQNLHGIRDSFVVYLTLKNLLPKMGSTPKLRAAIDLIGDNAISGIYHLAYSGGPKSSFPARMPNIRQFMNRLSDSASGVNYYWSFYEYDQTKGAMANISNQATCHYHTHVLKLISDIHSYLNNASNRKVIEQLPEGWKAYEALTTILAAPPEAVGTAGSTSAVYQFFLSESDPRIKYNFKKCESLESEILDPAATSLYRSLFPSN